MVTNKIGWITNLKGLAILAVVVGHLTTPLSKFIYAWHIPLFFFLSGLLIDIKKPFRDSIKKDIKNLIVPFVVFGLIGLIAEYVKRWLWPGFDFANGEIVLKDELMGLLWWMDYRHMHHYGFVLWFLPALFWTKNIYLVLIRSLNNRLLVTAVATILFVLVVVFKPALPFGIGNGLIGLLWLSMGWIITGKYWWLCLVALVWMRVPTTNLALAVIDGYGLVYSIVFINFLVGLFKWCGDRFKLLALFGERTLPILIVHPYVNNLVYFVIIYLLRLNWMVEMIVVIIMVYLIVKIYAKVEKI